MSMVCNRYPGVRCALVHNKYTSQMARKHNNANMIALGARVLEETIIIKIIDTFLETEYENEERHDRRLAMF